MILTVVWIAASLVGLVTQQRLYRWARLATMRVGSDEFARIVATSRMRASVVRLCAFAVALGTGVYALVAYYALEPWFAVSPVSLCLVAILLGFVVNGVIDLWAWQRIAAMPR